MRGQALVNLARSLAGQSKFEEAEATFLRGYAILESQLPKGHERRSIAANAIADMYERWQRPDSASEWRLREAPAPAPIGP